MSLGDINNLRTRLAYYDDCENQWDPLMNYVRPIDVRAALAALDAAEKRGTDLEAKVGRLLQVISDAADDLGFICNRDDGELRGAAAGGVDNVRLTLWLTIHCKAAEAAKGEISANNC